MQIRRHFLSVKKFSLRENLPNQVCLLYARSYQHSQRGHRATVENTEDY